MTWRIGTLAVFPGRGRSTHCATEPRRRGDANGARPRGARSVARRRAHHHSDLPQPRRRAEHQGWRGGGALRSHADHRSLGTALLAPGQAAAGIYRTVARDPARATELHGRAVRDAAVAAAFRRLSTRHPVARGTPGNRTLLSHLGENLASKGFVVAALDHPDSTHTPTRRSLFEHALQPAVRPAVCPRRTRPAVSCRLRQLSGRSRGRFANGDHRALSMGGYGVLSTLGAGFADASITATNAPPNRLLLERAASKPGIMKQADRRIKAAIAIAPYGGAVGMRDTEGSRAITTPTLFVGGGADDAVGAFVRRAHAVPGCHAVGSLSPHLPERVAQRAARFRHPPRYGLLRHAEDVPLHALRGRCLGQRPIEQCSPALSRRPSCRSI
ncbi:MAG: hypothetical protein MZV63_23620 [Marinilabiliales bacterium]|nr:hypothetical protein [Marinilabiliales bacterium]